MDLHHVTDYLQPNTWQELQDWQPDWTWVGGGTWLFSELRTDREVFVDLEDLGWSEIAFKSTASTMRNVENENALFEGLVIGATCTLNNLLRFLNSSDAISQSGARALQQAVSALASFKVTQVATVGGNLCLALPVSTLAPVMVAMDAIYEIWNVSDVLRYVPALDFQLGDRKTVLAPGEVLRRIWIPGASFDRQTSFQRIGVAASDPALAIAVAAYHPKTNGVRFGLGGCFAAPRIMKFSKLPTSAEISTAIEQQFALTDFLTDTRASSAYRRQLIQVLMQRALEELQWQSN
jgi:CO/xanthine dehydrogenase FAD-binding subunit